MRDTGASGAAHLVIIAQLGECSRGGRGESANQATAPPGEPGPDKAVASHRTPYRLGLPFFRDGSCQQERQEAVGNFRTARDLEKNILPRLEKSDLAAIVGDAADYRVVDFDDHVAAREVHVFGEAGGLDFGD